MKPYIFVLLFFGVFYLIEIVSVVRILGKNLPTLRRIKITFRINILIFFTGFLMLSIAILFDINYLRYELPIPYLYWKNITFTDFRGVKRPNQALDGQKDFAFIVSELKVKRINDGIMATTYFHPARSYVYNTDLASNELLTHEIYHLHITEYSARLLRKKIKNTTKPISDNTLEAIKSKFQFFEDSLQFQYDDQTYHSYLVGKQKNWQHQIDSCLKSLKEYENPTITDK
jgi:hypothetical protein